MSRIKLFKKIAIVGSFVFLAVGLVLVMPKEVGAYRSGAEIDNFLPGGANTIVSVENMAQAANWQCGSNRTCLNNNGMPYWQSVWISPSGRPNAGSQLTLPSSTTSVPLQINTFFFLTTATSAVRYNSTAGLGTVSYTWPENRVTSSNYPNDRRPASSPTVNVAAIKASRSKVYAAQVVSGGGYLTNVQIGGIFGTVTDSYSRYALGSPVGFTYNSGQWTGFDRTVTVRFTISTLNTFHSAPPGGTSQCYDSAGRLINPGANGFDRCGRYTVDYSFRFFVVPVWSLNPSVDLGGKSSAAAGETVTVSPTITNSGEGPSSNTYWSLSTMTYPPGSTPPTGTSVSDNNGQASAVPARPCQHFQGRGASNCQTVRTGTGNYPPGQNPLNNIDHVIGNYPLGTKVCYALSVFSRDNSDLDPTRQQWGHSALVCLTVGKKPNVHVIGGDLIVGNATIANLSNVTTSTATKRVGSQNRTFGSWSEYAIIASGVVSGMSSGSGYSGGSTTTDFCDLSLLTFSNASRGSCGVSVPKGGYKVNKGLPDVGSRFFSSSNLGSNPTVDISTRNSGVYRGTGNISISASSGVQAGKSVIINAPNATVTITGNIQYSGGVLRSVSDLPQVVIIANRINIRGSVTQVDAWLVARGDSGILNTCSDVGDTAALTASICDRPLTVNGPVVAQKLLLRRTAGADSIQNSGDPAEVFNLRPDAYLWAAARSINAGRVQSVYSKELPPRF